MKPVDLVTEALWVCAHTKGVSRHVSRAAVLTALCGTLVACGSVDDLGGPPIDEGTEDTGSAQAAIVGTNGLGANGLGANGLGSNGLGSNGLGSNGLGSNGLVTANTQNWLQTEPTALTTMPYIVACAAASGTTVRATVNGVSYTWPGNFGLAPNWLNNTPLTTAQQEWVSACLLASVNLAGQHVWVSFRSADATVPSLASERSAYNCREAAFMGNLFTASSADPLPLVQCRDNGAQTGTGRSCDPNQKNYNCAVDCYAACDKSSDAFSSCSVSVNGALRTYSRVLTTYLPTDSAQGCPGWGYNVTSRSAGFSSNGAGSSWSWGWGYTLGYSSCSEHCGGYASSGCSCAPDCAANGNCCADFAPLCGTQPPYVAPTSGQSSCPAGYSTYTGYLGGSGAVSYWPSASGYTVTLSGAQHATLLGPSSSNYNLSLQVSRNGTWSEDALSERNGSSESIHYFYGKQGATYRWKVASSSGTGSYTLCMNDVRGNTLKNVNSSQCMGAAGGGVDNSTPIVQQSCVGRSYQGFRLQSVGTNRYVLQNVNSGKCVDVPSGTADNGAVMQEWDCNGSSAQQWDAIVSTTGDGSKSFRSVASGKCLDVSGWSMSEGAQLVQWDCHYGTNQRYWVQ